MIGYCHEDSGTCNETPGGGGGGGGYGSLFTSIALRQVYHKKIRIYMVNIMTSRSCDEEYQVAHFHG